MTSLSEPEDTLYQRDIDLDNDNDKKHSQSSWIHRIPVLHRASLFAARLPRRYKLACLVVWVLWKVVVAVVVVHLVSSSSATSSSQQQPPSSSHPTRILYIVTSLSEYNTGRRQTKAGQDRLGDILLPVLVDSVESMVHPPYEYQVDVYLILAYRLRPDREAELRRRLPPSVGLQVWDEACPLTYDARFSPTALVNNTRALSRQHRLVIKDKLSFYDLFVAMEDDMRVTGAAVDQYLKVSEELDRLRALAPASLPVEPTDPLAQRFAGPLTRRQLDRLLPGFVRVQVLLNATAHLAQERLDPIPVDHEYDGVQRHFAPHHCCHVHRHPNDKTPVTPSRDDVVVWETNIKALSVRHLSGASALLDWVVLLPGPGKRLAAQDFVGGYWSGRDGDFGNQSKPSPDMPDLIAQQGGWMATKEQIVRLQTDCMGSLLPPFDEPMYRNDGLASKRVEYWSGGYQLFTGVLGGCNRQRIVSLEPDALSRHFLYHMANNNKQDQLAQRRMVKVDDLLGQLRTVQKRAMAAAVVA